MKRFYTALFRSCIPVLCFIRFADIKAQNIYLVDSAHSSIITFTPVTTVEAAAWNNATGSLQAALNAAIASGGGQIWVKAGTYKPIDYPNGCSSCSTDRDKAFLLRNNITLYGGFAGMETLLSQRSVGSNPTILSGDIGTLNVTSDNSYHVLITVNSDSTAVLDGFTVTGGNADGAGSITIMGQNSRRNTGPGMLNDSLSSPTIRNCTFINGGGMSNVNRCLPKITNCAFADNTGTGMYNDTASSPVIANCAFTNTTGYAVVNNAGSTPGISNCSFTNNNGSVYNDISSPNISNCTFTSTAGYAVANNTGSNSIISDCSFINNNGSVSNYVSRPNISNCIFTNSKMDNGFSSTSTISNCTFTNSSMMNSTFTVATITNCTFANSSDAILLARASVSVTNCVFINNTNGIYDLSASSATVTNCVFANNSANGINFGGNSGLTATNSIFTNNGSSGIRYSSNSTNFKITNCTFANNGSYGIFYSSFVPSGPVLTNCIIWGNGVSGISVTPGLMTPVTTYSIVQGGYAGTGNLNIDPLFINAALPAGADGVFGTADDGLQLQPCSPAINSGSNAAVPAGTITDLIGASRINNGVVDMGAYEYQGSPGFLATNDNSATAAVSIGSTTQFITNCQLIASVQSTGTSPVSGNTTARVWVEAAQPTYNGQTFVKRHYEITPASNSSIATGRVTLYATQPEFDDFNNYGNNTNLPMSPADAVGKARLRIIKFSGQSSNGTGLPATYTQPGMEINPADSNIVWNNGLQRWEISFDVTGFSGFLIGDAASSILPLTLLNFTAKTLPAGSALLSWRTARKVNTAFFELQRSRDNYSYTTITQVQAKGTAQGEAAYSYTDEGLAFGLYYYRLRMVDKDGKEKYSAVVTLNVKAQNAITLYPVPAKEVVWLSGGAASLNGSSALLMDMQGRVLQTIHIQQWPQPVNITTLAAGYYLIKLPGETTIKLIKQ